jgi:hypothetical protein
MRPLGLPLVFLLSLLHGSFSNVSSLPCSVKSHDGTVLLGIKADGTLNVVRGINQMVLNVTSVSLDVTLVGVGAETRVTLARVEVLPNGCQVEKHRTGDVVTVEVYEATETTVRSSVIISSKRSDRVQVEVTTSVNFDFWDAVSMAWWTSYDSALDGTLERSPLSPMYGGLPETPDTYEYGGWKFMTLEPRPGSIRNNSITLPILSWLQNDAGAGISFVGSPEDSTTYMTLQVAQASGGGGEFTLNRRFLSVGGNATALRLSGDWISHKNCWRPALGHFFETYPDYALPDARIPDVEGAGTYAYFFGQATNDKAYYTAMDLAFNWDASFPWLYHGPWVPFPNNRQYFPLPEGEGGEFVWTNCDPAGHGGHDISTKPDYPACMNQSYGLLNGWYKGLKDRLGVKTLAYATLNEYGFGIDLQMVGKGDVPQCTAKAGNASAQYSNQLICGANRLLSDKFPNAVVRDATKDGQPPIYGAWSSVITDVGDEQYQQFMLENARRVVDNLTESSGICIDRGDWIGVLNAAGDDKISMANGHVVRPLLYSWKRSVPQLAEILHKKGKALYMNPDMGHRIDLHKGVDGFFSELGDTKPGHWRTATSYLSAGGKSSTIWCHDPHNNPTPTKCGEMMTNGTDKERNQFLQSHLLLGVYPSVPFPDNDHILQPSPRADAIYQDYGPMFTALHGKRWCTAPHCVRIEGKKAYANAFEMKPFGTGKYALSIAGGSLDTTHSTVAALMENIPELADRNPVRVTALCFFPGESEPVHCKAEVVLVQSGLTRHQARITVPLKRGTGVVVLQFERGRRAANDCKYLEYDLEEFRNTTLSTLPKAKGGKFDLSLCGNLPGFCIDSLTHKQIPGQVYAYFGEPGEYHCWDVLVLPHVVPKAREIDNGLRLTFTRQGDAHLSCTTITVQVDIVCQPDIPIPSHASLTGYQDGCIWYMRVATSAPGVCRNYNNKNTTARTIT